MKKVLLLGDSIRRSYQEKVRERLLGTADVTWVDDNSRFTKYTLFQVAWPKLDEQFGHIDLIHWNNGLWDLMHLNREIGVLVPVEEYIAALKRILKELKRTGADVIWSTTTPVKEGNKYRFNSEVDIYNEESKRLMKENDVFVNDLNLIVKADIDSYICEDGVHLTEAGTIVCAEAVAEIIRLKLMS